ncbi:MAG: hypothetical protein WCX73_05145 [Candidatus Pacearchaeota archaeon]
MKNSKFKTIKNKKASIPLELIIFLLLNLVFFIVMLFFAYSSGDKEFVYEQTLSKEIALIIDNSRPGTIVSLDITRYVELAKENKKELEDIVKINTEDNSVEVNLKQSGGYSYQYFSDYDVSVKTEANLLILNIEEKIE